MISVVTYNLHVGLQPIYIRPIPRSFFLARDQSAREISRHLNAIRCVGIIVVDSRFQTPPSDGRSYAQAFAGEKQLKRIFLRHGATSPYVFAKQWNIIRVV